MSFTDLNGKYYLLISHVSDKKDFKHYHYFQYCRNTISE